MPLTSRCYVFSMLSSGCGVVASHVGGIPEAVTTQTGILVPPMDSRSLAVALARMITRPVLRKQLGNNGRRRYLAHFTFDRMVDQTLAVYYAAARTQAAPAAADLALSRR